VLCELKSPFSSYIYDLWVKDRSVLAMVSQKRRALSLEERVQVIKSSERGVSSRSIAERLGVGRTQIQTTIKSLRQKTAVQKQITDFFSTKV